MLLFECPDCNSKTEYSSDITEDVIVCPSCQTLHDVVVNTNTNTNTNTTSKDIKLTTTKSKYDKTNYKNKIAGITNQLASTGGANYTVPCPHCQHNWEMKGIPIKSVHQCSKCYGYFGINDVKISIFSKGKGKGKEKQFKHGFQVSAIYSDSIFDRDIDKLADYWSNYYSRQLS